MSEELPEKLFKGDNEDESALTDATEASNLTDENDMSETMDIPQRDDLPVGIGAVPGDESMEDGTEMVEERLQDSMESQESQGQEEWLSEEVLTDDDFNSAAETADSQTSQPENSQSEPSPVADEITEPEKTEPETLEPEQVEPVNTDTIATETAAKIPEQNIEDALNTLQGGPEKEVELSDLDEFLIKKTEVKTDKCEEETEDKKEQDDGNDTDDLLRMLGEDGNKTKKLTKTVKDVRISAKNETASSDDDDDFVFEGASAKKFKLAKSLPKKQPPIAKPEVIDEEMDQSSDEQDTLKNVLSAKKSRSDNHGKSSKQVVKTRSQSSVSLKNIAAVEDKSKKVRMATSTPLRTRTRSLLKAPQKVLEVKKGPIAYSRPKQPATKAPLKSTTVLKTPIKVEGKREPDEVRNEKRQEGENYHMPEEEFESDFDDETSKSRQRILKPERMEEEAPSDPDSHSEDGSLYDELPSSESEDAEDWFQLDIRAEKAGDYLPLLGAKAKELLLEEKQRVSARLANLKQSLGALTESGKKQAEQVRSATMALAELDDMLKAS